MGNCGNCEKFIQRDCLKIQANYSETPQIQDHLCQIQQYQNMKFIKLANFKNRKHKNQIDRQISIINKDQQYSNFQKVTYFKRTGPLHKGINYVVTNQSLSKFPCQFLIIFSDTIAKIIQNPFIKQIFEVHGSESVLSFKLELAKAQKQFCNIGDFLQIIDPFPKSSIPNLIVLWTPVYLGKNQHKNLQNLIEIAFDKISQAPSQITFGIIQISSNLGYQTESFQKQICYRAQQFSQKIQRKIKLIYWTYSKFYAQQFVRLLKSSIQTISLTNKSQSDYF